MAAAKTEIVPNIRPLVSFFHDFCLSLLLQSLWVYSLINYTPPTYDNDDYQYPTWAHALGWCYTAASLSFIPIFAVYALLKADGDTFAEVSMCARTFYEKAE